MEEKIQYEDSKLKIYAPDSLKFIVDDIIKYFGEQYKKVLNFYHLEKYVQYRINLFDDIQKFREFVVKELRNGNNTLPNYAVGTYDKGMCNQYIELKKNQNGIYIIKDNEEIEYISNNIYKKAVALPVHELVHIIYPNNVIHGDVELRVVWIDEGLAQNLSGQYSYLENDIKEFTKFYNKVKEETKYIPTLKGIKHGKTFKNEDYDLYKLSYLAVRYLFETMIQEEIYNIIMDYEKSNEIGEHIMKDMFEYFDKKISESGENNND